MKKMYKIKLQRWFFWNLQQMTEVTWCSCWHQDFVIKRLSAPIPGLYTCIKSWKSCIKSDLSTVKGIFTPPRPPPPIVYASDRSKAVVVFFLFCVPLWFILWGASCFKVFPCSLFSCFVIPFSIVIISLGKEGAGLCASRAFVCLLCMC